MLQSKVLFVSPLRVKSIDGFRFNFELFIFQLYHGCGRYMLAISIILLWRKSSDTSEKISHISYDNKCDIITHIKLITELNQLSLCLWVDAHLLLEENLKNVFLTHNLNKSFLFLFFLFIGMSSNKFCMMVFIHNARYIILTFCFRYLSIPKIYLAFIFPKNFFCKTKSNNLSLED